MLLQYIAAFFISIGSFFGIGAEPANETSPNAPVAQQEESTAAPAPAGPAVSGSVAAEISGGHETVPGDGGRPDALIAGALGIPEEAFRYAFSFVTPEPNGAEHPATAQRNKSELLPRLAEYGVTNDRLDTVMNYYRYVPQSGGLWPTDAADVRVDIEGGKIVGFTVLSGGSGYTSTPTITVPGFGQVQADVKLGFSSDFSQNGTILSVTVRR